ncbi:MAG: uracil-DNA glycosylase family protein, partial [bacterium]
TAPAAALKGSAVYAVVLLVALGWMGAGLSVATAITVMGGAALAGGAAILADRGLLPLLCRRSARWRLAWSDFAGCWEYGKWLLGIMVVGWFAGAAYVPLAAAVAGLSAAGTIRAIDNLFQPVSQGMTGLAMLASPWLARRMRERGAPFVGPAGQLLDQVIQEYGFKSVAIGNVVRCRPPGDRKPHVGEVAACLPYLKEEIRAVKPKIIVCLGNTPLEALTGKAGVSSYSGTVVLKVGDITIFSLYHPSYILRMPGQLPLFEQHLRELRKVIDGEYGSNKKSLDVASVGIDVATKWITHAKSFVAFDYETTGLHKGADGKVRSIWFSDGVKSWVVNAELPGSKDFMRWFLENENIKKIVHNL